MRIHFDDLVVDENQLHLYNDKPFSGVAIEKFANGSLSCEQEFCEGIESGKRREWFPSGSLKTEAYITRGVLNGLKTQWFESGKKQLEAQYLKGICTARTQWSEDGEVVEQYEVSENDWRLKLL